MESIILWTRYFILKASKPLLALSILGGLLLGSLATVEYTGTYLTTFIFGSKSPLLQSDDLTPKRIGFNYLHNLKAFPKGLFSNPGNYELIHIYGGHFNSMPGDIRNFTNLKFFAVSNVDLHSLPNEIGEISTLEWLNLGGNEIKSLPDSIGNLGNLKKLYLYHNRLSSIPDSISNLIGLEVLDLHSNKLKALPPGIGSLTNLKILYLGGNNFSPSEKQKIKSALPNAQIFF